MEKIAVSLIIVLILAGCQGPPQSENQRREHEARQLIIKSLEALNNKDLKSAVLNLEEAINADPSEVEAFFLLGQVFMRAGQSSQAAQVFEYAAHLFPQNGTVFYMLAIAANGAGNKTEALAAARRSVEIFSEKQGEEEVFKNSMFMAMVLWRSLGSGTMDHASAP